MALPLSDLAKKGDGSSVNKERTFRHHFYLDCCVQKQFSVKRLNFCQLPLVVNGCNLANHASAIFSGNFVTTGFSMNGLQFGREIGSWRLSSARAMTLSSQGRWTEASVAAAFIQLRCPRSWHQSTSARKSRSSTGLQKLDWLCRLCCCGPPPSSSISTTCKCLQ